ncbi:hypothetical protein EIP86_002574 [Pleurotus ostreatoroseus]|nr:hypothetical protein EIP86_002574 [Pleurotus ostreatoroseus]
MTQIPEQARQYYLSQSGAIDNITLRTFAVPKPKPNQVLVKIHAVSLNVRPLLQLGILLMLMATPCDAIRRQFRDIMIVYSQYPGVVRDKPVPVSDGAGEVVAIGEDVRKWKVGDRVAANFALDHISGDTSVEIQHTMLGGGVDGVLTEYQVFPEYVRVTAWMSLQGPVPVKAGDFVLLQGTGGVSIFALQFAVASGAAVIVTSSSNDKLALVKKLGAKYTINYKETPDWDKEVLKITNGEGVHHVLELGGPATLVKSINSVRLSGHVHIIGAIAGIDAREEAPLGVKILFKDARLRGIIVGSRTMFEDMNRALATHQIKPLIDTVFSFEEATAAYKHLESQKHIGKVVIRVASN